MAITLLANLVGRREGEGRKKIGAKKSLSRGGVFSRRWHHAPPLSHCLNFWKEREWKLPNFTKDHEAQICLA